MSNTTLPLSRRFRGYLPVVIDIETGGFHPKQDAILEIAAVTIDINEQGLLVPSSTLSHHIVPFQGANLDAKSMAFTGIDPFHPFRMAVSEKKGLEEIFAHIKQEAKKHRCQRAIMVAHNACFDMSFISAAIERNAIKHNPFHPFSTLDTVSLSALTLGQTVLARALEAAKIEFDKHQAHSALYDASKTAELFCFIVNQWQKHGGWDIIQQQPILID